MNLKTIVDDVPLLIILISCIASLLIIWCTAIEEEIDVENKSTSIQIEITEDGTKCYIYQDSISCNHDKYNTFTNCR